MQSRRLTEDETDPKTREQVLKVNGGMLLLTDPYLANYEDGRFDLCRRFDSHIEKNTMQTPPDYEGKWNGSKRKGTGHSREESNDS